MTVSELLSKTTARELSEWSYYFKNLNEKPPESKEELQKKITNTFLPMMGSKKKKKK